jgi:hypothetical protein
MKQVTVFFLAIAVLFVFMTTSEATHETEKPAVHK